MRFQTLALSTLLVITAPAQGLGAVFTLTNQVDRNEVAVALRHRGSLIPLARFDTGGTGTAAGLGSQGALAIAGAGHWLLAVNPGSDELTVFRTIFGILLLRTDVVASGGDMPTSIAAHGNLVYALHAGVPNNVSGFRLHGGRLRQIPGATYALSQPDTMPAQVAFDPSGRFLVVTERATNKIDVFPVRRDGTLGDRMVEDSAGTTPFGFEFGGRGTLIVSEAFANAPNASAVSSYALGPDGSLKVISASVPTQQTAACWIAITPGNRFAYSTNTGSGSVTGFEVGGGGTLTSLTANGRTGVLPAGSAPIDADFDRSGRVLFVLDSGRDEITAFAREADGRLTPLSVAWSLPDGAAGLIAR
jgi:6-phosphogluconolactonase (cycloisomerase 2 family)